MCPKNSIFISESPWLRQTVQGRAGRPSLPRCFDRAAPCRTTDRPCSCASRAALRRTRTVVCRSLLSPSVVEANRVVVADVGVDLAGILRQRGQLVAQVAHATIPEA